MPLTPAEVEHIAELAKLSLTPEEIERIGTQLSAILDYAAELRAVDTSAISPTATVLPLHTVLREDVVQPSLSRESVLANASEHSDDSFKVPAVME
jgi:aspartyl-tRNA(Asn)/glutamyl-tRNA(Gln) amidotransferase subunit C